MRPRTAILVALVAAAGAVALVIGAGVGDRDGVRATGSAATARGTPTRPGPTAGHHDQSGSKNPAGGELAPVQDRSGGESPGRPPSRRDRDGDSARTTMPVRLPGLTPAYTRALVAAPLPPQAARSSGLVHGWPSRLRVAPGTRIATSSVAPAERSLQIALDARSHAPGGSVLRYYRISLAALGFKEVPGTTVGGSRGATFRRPVGDSLVVTVRPVHGGSAYSLFGTLHASAR